MIRSSIWRKLWRTTLWLLAAIMLFINGYLLSGRILGNLAVNAHFTPDNSGTGVPIYILSNGVHTDIAVPVETDLINWRLHFPPETFSPPSDNPSYIAFGWGEKNLYDKVPTWDKLTTEIFINALLLPSKSSMHVTYFADPPQDRPARPVRKVLISMEAYAKLVAFVEASLVWDEHEQPIKQDCCWYAAVSDNFYDSPPTYHLFRTCNHWTVNALQETGVPAPVWTPFAQDIIYQLESAAE